MNKKCKNLEKYGFELPVPKRRYSEEGMYMVHRSDLEKIDASTIDESLYVPDHPLVLRKKYGVLAYGDLEQTDKRELMHKDLDARFERHGALLGAVAGDSESLGDAIAEDPNVIARIAKEEYGVELTEEDIYNMPFFHCLDILYNKLDLDEDDPNRYKP